MTYNAYFLNYDFCRTAVIINNQQLELDSQKATINNQQKMNINHSEDITFLKQFTKELEAKINNPETPAFNQTTGNK